MPAFTDQMGHTIELPQTPQRIISIVPSQTELLYALGLDEEVVGQTLFCIHPEWQHQSKPRVGGTKKLSMERIHELEPDLIIGNKEENEQSQIEELKKHYPVWMSDIRTLDDALDMIRKLGEVVDRKEEALQLSAAIEAAFTALSPKPSVTSDGRPTHTAPAVLYLIWRDPWMAAGPDTFIHDMLQRCGWHNLAPQGRYPELSDEQLCGLKPDLILLSSEPFPFSEKYLPELQRICPDTKTLLVDGEMFSWYGSRLLKAVEYFRQLQTAQAK